MVVSAVVVVSVVVTAVVSVVVSGGRVWGKGEKVVTRVVSEDVPVVLSVCTGTVPQAEQRQKAKSKTNMKYFFMTR